MNIFCKKAMNFCFQKEQKESGSSGPSASQPAPSCALSWPGRAPVAGCGSWWHWALAGGSGPCYHRRGADRAGQSGARNRNTAPICILLGGHGHPRSVAHRPVFSRRSRLLSGCDTPRGLTLLFVTRIKSTGPTRWQRGGMPRNSSRPPKRRRRKRADLSKRNGEARRAWPANWRSRGLTSRWR